MSQTYRAGHLKIAELGGYAVFGINWEFAFFDNDQAAQEFFTWLDGNWESRGVRSATHDELACVRFRWVNSSQV